MSSQVCRALHWDLTQTYIITNSRLLTLEQFLQINKLSLIIITNNY